MAEKLSAKSAWKLNNALKKSAATKPTKVGTARVTRRGSDGSMWVRLPGSNVDTPVNGQVLSDAAVGDTVSVRIENGRLSLMGNATTPAVGQQQVNTTVQPVSRQATYAMQAAELATTYAMEAQESAALADASAKAAGESAYTAGVAADGALLGLSTVQDVIDVIEWLSTHSSATEDTSVVADKEYYVRDATTGALSRVEEAVDPFALGWVEAEQSADTAMDTAKTYYALNDATGTLTPVADVVDPSDLGWYEAEASADTEAVDGKTYYELDAETGELTPVDEVPEGADPSELGWYEVSATSDTTMTDGKLYYTVDAESGVASPVSPVVIGWWEISTTADNRMVDDKGYYALDSETGVASPIDPFALGWWEMGDAVVQFIGSHLAQTDHGLNVMASGQSGHIHIGTLKDGGEYGTYVVGEDGVPEARFGVHTRIGREDGMHVDITSDISEDLEHDVHQHKLLSIANAGDAPVMYVEYDDETRESTVYMTNAIVVQDLRFGDWMWYERANGNMSVRWTGDDA